jgi:hypothetical protein
MTSAIRRRGLLLALALSGGMHGLVLLLLCLSRGSSAEADPVSRKPAFEPYWGTPNSTHLFVLRPVRTAVQPADPHSFEVTLAEPASASQAQAPPAPIVVGRGLPSPIAGQVSIQGTPTPTVGGSNRSGARRDGPTGSGLFPAGTEIKSVVFVLDRSLSMGVNGGLRLARTEVCACLNALPPTVRFQVVPYDDARQALPLSVEGCRDLLAADPATVAAMVTQVDALRAHGATNHLAGLRCGLALRPEIVYFVTDADDFGEAEAKATLRMNIGHSKIDVVHLTAAPGREESLWRLAVETGGTYRKIRPGQHLERAEGTGSQQVRAPRDE